jgi:hypothetical protein
MIFNLFVIDNGLCIYSYNYRKEKDITIDEQLMSGFLTAIGQFAKETFKTGLQTIGIQGGKKLSFFIEESHQLIFCAMSDDRDNNKLLEKILRDISYTFVKDMASVLSGSDRSRVSSFQIFDEKMESFVKKRSKKRNIATMFQGIIVGILSLIVFFLIFAALYDKTPLNLRSLFLIIYLPIVIAISSIVSGYFAGTPKMGRNNGVLFYFIFAIMITVLVPGIWESLISIAPFILIVCIAMGYFGGLKCDERRLYPLPEDTIVANIRRAKKEKIEKINQVFDSDSNNDDTKTSLHLDLDKKED